MARQARQTNTALPQETAPKSRRAAPARKKVTDAAAQGVVAAAAKDAADGEEDAKISSPDSVVDYICNSILDSRIVPGQRLIENDLTQTLNVSRGPVREAFRRLDALGVLSRSLHRGAYVRRLSRREAVDLVEAIVPLSTLIAKLAAVACAQNGPSFRARVEKDLNEFINREEFTNNVLQQRRHFYEVLITIGGNSQLASILPTMRIHLLRIQIYSFLDASNNKAHVNDYFKIAQYILAGDIKKAERRMQAHLESIRDTLLALPDLAFLVADAEDR